MLLILILSLLSFFTRKNNLLRYEYTLLLKNIFVKLKRIL